MPRWSAAFAAGWMLVSCSNNPIPQAEPAPAPAPVPVEPAIEEAPAEPDGPPLNIATTVHGVLVTPDLQPIELDASKALELQTELLDLVRGSSHQQSVRAALDTHALPLEERLAAQDALISWMLEDPELEQRYGATHQMLRPAALGYAGVDLEFWKERDGLASLLYGDLEIADHRYTARLRGQDYLNECAANSVPLPPNWPSSSWVWRGDVSTSLAFIASTPRIAVYTYQNPGVPGICYALPRINGSDISLMGIICQSQNTGKACFWDNIDFQTGARITGPLTTSIPILSLQNGNDLVENCTNCHRGDNAFIIHPNSPLDQRPTSNANTWYEPISNQPAWANPSPFIDLGDSACTSCHRIAGIGASFCSTVVSNAANKTMPNQVAPVGWLSSQPDVKAIRDACAGTLPVCGNGTCQLGETDCTCPSDCPPDPNSCSTCECGSSSGNCWCDDLCEGFGDCCSDKASTCGTPGVNGNSCQSSASCGGQAPAGCWCDQACLGFGDCCFDGPC
jgi:hypothetical protein